MKKNFLVASRGFFVSDVISELGSVALGARLPRLRTTVLKHLDRTFGSCYLAYGPTARPGTGNLFQFAENLFQFAEIG